MREIKEQYRSYGPIPHQYRNPLRRKDVLIALTVIVVFLLLVIAFVYLCFMHGFGIHFLLLMLLLAATIAFIHYVCACSNFPLCHGKRFLHLRRNAASQDKHDNKALLFQEKMLNQNSRSAHDASRRY